MRLITRLAEILERPQLRHAASGGRAFLALQCCNAKRLLFSCRSTRIRGRTIFTFRGLVSLLVSAYLIRAVAIPESDLVAYMVGGAFAFLPGFAALSTFTQYALLRKKISVSAHFDSGTVVSRSEVKAGLTILDANPFPLSEFEVKRVFLQDGVVAPSHILRGSLSERRILLDSVYFPHRGLWRLDQVSILIRDRLGLSALQFNLACQAVCEVSAQEIPIAALPIIASSAKAGDVMESTLNRTGDPFDIKAYDPSDGVSRILWKAFAKSGELVVRRPEPSVVPDGEVAIYLVANCNEDFVAGSFRNYLNQLRSQNVGVLFGTDGASGKVLSSEEAILRTMNETVWAPGVGSAREFGAYLDQLANMGRSVVQIVLFGPERRSDWIEVVQRECASRSLAVHFAVVPEAFDEFIKGVPPSATAARGWRAVPRDSSPALSVSAMHSGEYHLVQRRVG